MPLSVKTIISPGNDALFVKHTWTELLGQVWWLVLCGQQQPTQPPALRLRTAWQKPLTERTPSLGVKGLGMQVLSVQWDRIPFRRSQCDIRWHQIWRNEFTWEVFAKFLIISQGTLDGLGKREMNKTSLWSHRNNFVTARTRKLGAKSKSTDAGTVPVQALLRPVLAMQLGPSILHLMSSSHHALQIGHSTSGCLLYFWICFSWDGLFSPIFLILSWAQPPGKMLLLTYQCLSQNTQITTSFLEITRSTIHTGI